MLQVITPCTEITDLRNHLLLLQWFIVYIFYAESFNSLIEWTSMEFKIVDGEQGLPPKSDADCSDTANYSWK